MRAEKVCVLVDGHAKPIPWDRRSADSRLNRVEWSEVSGVALLEPESGDVYVGEILLKNGGAGRKTAGQETSSHLITREFFVLFYFSGGAVIEEHEVKEDGGAGRSRPRGVQGAR